MPGLVRKLIIFATIDGLILQPVPQKGQKAGPSTKIGYKTNNISYATHDPNNLDNNRHSFESFGIIGLLTLSKSTFLISITRRRQVAQIENKPIYVITEVALTPLSTQVAAQQAIKHTKSTLQKADYHDEGLAYHGESDESDESDDEESIRSVASDLEDEVVHPEAVTPGLHKRTSSIAEDVISKKGGYGRFAQNWFSKNGWNSGQKRNLGMTATDGTDDRPSSSVKNATTRTIDTDALLKAKENIGDKAEDVVENLLPKLLRTTQMLFGTSQSYFFSYDYDLTRSFANRRRTNLDLPLHTQVDPLYFWNRNLQKPLIEVGHHGFILPLMQGFVGQREFEVDFNPPQPTLRHETSSMELADFPSAGVEDQSHEKGISHNTKSSFFITLISRRSVKRAGLRYLRRGVDDEGNVANSVETEQILSDNSWTASKKIHSFVQIRGSIPIFFSQTPYSFKPVPQIQHSAETNHAALTQHFRQLNSKYGNVQVVSLVEKHGNEAIVGNAYQHHVQRLNDSRIVSDPEVGFEWFDFHNICRGMKFENVSLLMNTLGSKLDEFGHSVEVDGKPVSKQGGVLRVNCMDCLDRTNVVQSACGRRALEEQLKEEGFDLSVQVDQATNWFNTLWADNGDAISKQYASTAALKGDFTRTRKRDYRGALTDMGLSITRFYSGVVNDYFSQAAIDFLLGNVTAAVFEDFEANMMSGDLAVSAKKMRQQAIETCQRLVIADQHEEAVGGWTLLMPNAPNTIKSTPFEESVLLLTDAAVYACKFDWNMEKVSSFERVDLQHITSIKYGTYITSTLSAAQSNEETNIGFVITYEAGTTDIARVNTRSFSSLQSRFEADLLDGTASTPQAQPSGIVNFLSQSLTPATLPRVLSAKALSSRAAVAEGDEKRLSEIEFVKTVCDEIERMALLGRVVEVGTERKSLVEEGDVISLAEARRSTGLLEHLGHSIKKLVWA